MTAESEAGEGLQSLARGLEVIRVLTHADEPMTLAQVAQEAGLNRAVTRRVLLTLQEVGYVLARGREFSLRPRVLEIGEAYRSALRLPRLGSAAMHRLVARTGQSCSMAVLDGADIVYVARVPGRRVVDAVLHVGTRLPAHATAMGRVLLAALEEDALDAVLASAPLEARTPRTITDPAALRAELRRARQHPWYRIDEELEPGLTTLAAPVRDADGAVVAAINLPLSTYALRGGEVPPGYAETLVRAAEDIRAALAGR